MNDRDKKTSPAVEEITSPGRERSRKVFAALFYMVLVVAAIWYFSAHREDYMAMLDLRLSHLAMLFLFSLLSRMLIGVRLKLLTRPFGLDLGLAEGTGLAFMQGYGNAVAIKGGTVGVAYYLYRKRGFGVDNFLAITGGGFIISVMTIGGAGLAGYAWVASVSEVRGPEIPLLFAVILAGGLGMLIFPRLKIKAGKLGAFISRIIAGWNVLKSGLSNVAMLMGVELLILTTFAARYWTAFRAFDQPIDFSQAFLLAPPAYLSLMVNVTPVGMGVREPLLAYMSGILGHAVAGGLGAAVLDSLMLVAICLVGGPLAASILVGKNRKTHG